MFVFLLLALLWFKKGKKELSLITFFGFLTGGYQLIPDAVFAFPVSIKPSDYAVLYLFAVIAMEYFSGKRKELIDVLPRFTLIFLSFIAVAAAVSLFIHHIPIVEVVKNTRQYFLLLRPILYYALTKEELLKVVDFLFKITFITSIIYILQPIFDTPLLQGYYTEGKSSLFGMFEIARFYNNPIYHNFFFFLILYNTERSKTKKNLYLIIMTLPILLCMHRSLLLAFIMVILFNKFRENIKKIYPILIVLLVALIPFLGAIQGGILETKIAQDIIGSLDIEPEDFVPGAYGDATFTFRVLHFLERLYYASENLITLLFGLGFMSEGSDYTISNFNFIVGLENSDTGMVNQVDTSDIAWSIFVIRLGVIGTIIYLIYYISLLSFFNKNKKDYRYNSILSTMLMVLIISFTGVRIIDMEFIAFILLMYVIFQKEKSNADIQSVNND